jgi:hypothetical protein
VELLSVLRALLRHGRLVAAGAVAATLAALAVAGWLPIADVASTGAARAAVLIDTPRPLAADAGVLGVDAIGARTALLAELMASDRMRRRTARGAGLGPDEITVVVPSMGGPRIATPLPDLVASAATRRWTPGVLTVTNDPAVPFITLRATAPDEAAAGRLVRAAAAALEASARGPAGGEGVVARPLGAPRTTTIVSGGRSRGLLALVGAALVLAAWCAAVVVADGAARARRRSVAGVAAAAR